MVPWWPLLEKREKGRTPILVLRHLREDGHPREDAYGSE